MGLFDNLGTMKSDFTPDDATHTVTVNLYFKGKEGEAQKAKEKGIRKQHRNNRNSSKGTKV